MGTHDNSKRKIDISRRKFLNIAASGTAVIAVNPLIELLGAGDQQVSKWPANASQYRFFMIGHAHIDPVWLWPSSEGISVVHSTFRSALDRMKETPEFTFISSSAQFYEWVAENDPGMLEEIRKRVDEGRWNIVGGWWVEPDVNIPCGEALIRQGLYGQLTLQRLLGHRAKVACNPDSFGHTQTLPQIIKKQGMENYIFMRPGPNEKSLPADLFWWEGNDGTKVLTYRIQISYNDTGSVRNRIERILTQASNQPMKSFMYYYGAGDHGGGATKENIRSIEELRNEKGAPAILYSTPEKYFEEIRADRNLKLPVVKDDLQHHAVGCYTAESAIKKGNRYAEAALITAEKITSVGSKAWDCSNPFKELTSAWKRILFLQFHDSLAGTSLYEHSSTAQEGYGFVLDTAHHAINMALQKLEWQVAAEDPASQYLLVFNVHGWEVNGIIEYDFNWAGNIKSSKVEDENGNPLPHQWTAGSTETGSRKKLIVRISIPPFGYRQLRLLESDSAISYKEASAKDNILENEFLRLTILKSGAVTLFDKESGKEVFSGNEGGCRALVIDDPSDTWSHDIKTFSKVIGAFQNSESKVIETGPLRATVRSVTTYGASTLSLDWSLYSGSRKVEVYVSLDWKEHLKMLKFSFPVDAESPVATYETPYGFIERDTNGNEEPGQRWIDLSGTRDGKIYGLTIMNDAKYGYSIPGSDLRISIARSAVYAHHNPRILDPKSEHLWQDQGIQTFRMLLVPHADTWKKNNITRIAEEFIAPPQSIYQGIHKGSKPKTGSFLSVDNQNIIVSSVKQSESGDELIVRCVETTGIECSATFTFWFSERKWSAGFKPGEIKTLKINHKSGEIKEVNLLEE
jgi:alpha-mannosidase